jgi:two-component system NtrC family sensor kinase
VLEDTEGGGATFTVTLPEAETKAEAEEALLQDNVVLPPNLKILLVDDEIEISQTLADLLELEGHHIDIAADGAIALKKLHMAPFDIIISDLRMPVMDGPSLYAALGRELPSYLNKIIYVTGDTLSSHVQSFLNQNPVIVVEKPYILADVRRAMASLLASHIDKVTMKSADSVITSSA